MKNKNRYLHDARSNNRDEFYTLYEDIERELVYYSETFENKIVYCNTDDYSKSSFVEYFKNNFKKLSLKKIVATSCNTIGRGLNYFNAFSISLIVCSVPP